MRRRGSLELFILRAEIKHKSNSWMLNDKVCPPPPFSSFPFNRQTPCPQSSVCLALFIAATPLSLPPSGTGLCVFARSAKKTGMNNKENKERKTKRELLKGKNALITLFQHKKQKSNRTDMPGVVWAGYYFYCRCCSQRILPVYPVPIHSAWFTA